MTNVPKIIVALALILLLAGCALLPPASTPWRRVGSAADTTVWSRRHNGLRLEVISTRGNAAYDVAVSDGRRAIVVTHSLAAARAFAEEFAAGIEAPPPK